MPKGRIVSRLYTREKPFLRVRITISNPETGRVNSFEQECWIDTGFSGGIHIPLSRKSEAELVDVTPKPTKLALAGGVEVPGYACLGSLTKIEKHDLPGLGIETELLMQGNAPHGLVGLEILKKYNASFNGPTQTIELFE
jgi:predicted aspartyl protease